MTNILVYLPALLSGVLVTITLMLASLLIGLFLAFIFTLIILSDLKPLKAVVNAILFFIRGTPVLVQLFLIYYGIGQFEFLRESFLWFIFKSPMWCAIIALAINTACYTTVLLLGAINSVPKNEIAATEAIGMSKWLALRRIILPLAFRIMLPAYSNEVVIVLKSTSLASTITILEMMGVTQQLISLTYNTVTFYLVAGGLYLSLNAVIMSVFAVIEKRLTIPQQSN